LNFILLLTYDSRWSVLRLDSQRIRRRKWTRV